MISLAIFHTGYHHHLLKVTDNKYIQRVLLTYLIILITVGIFLALIEQAHWLTEPGIALKRTILVGLPGSLSGVTADLIK